jgi:hypothetical protein
VDHLIGGKKGKIADIIKREHRTGRPSGKTYNTHTPIVFNQPKERGDNFFETKNK